MCCLRAVLNGGPPAVTGNSWPLNRPGLRARRQIEATEAHKPRWDRKRWGLGSACSGGFYRAGAMSTPTDGALTLADRLSSDLGPLEEVTRGPHEATCHRSFD